MLQRLLSLDSHALVSLSYFVLLPALQFVIITDSDLDGSAALREFLLATVVMAACLLIAMIASRILNLNPTLTAGVLVTAAFMNAGNYGLSLNKLAFGAEGLAWASVFYVALTLWANALGVFILSAGQASFKRAFAETLRVPALYGIGIALLFKLTGINVPEPIYRSIDLLAASTITVMLLIMGMQIAKSGLPVFNAALLIVLVIRLIVSPVIAGLISPAFQLPTLARNTAIIESGMPTAVVTGVLALKFDAEPDFIAGAIFITTLVSPLTLTLLLSALA